MFWRCFLVREMTSMSMVLATSYQLLGFSPTRHVKMGHFSGNLFTAHAQTMAPPCPKRLGPAGQLSASYSNFKRQHESGLFRFRWQLFSSGPQTRCPFVL